MRAVVLTGTGDFAMLQVQERPDPVPRSDEVIVEVRAAGVNFAELMARQGLYDDAPKLPAVLGYEVAGVVRGTDRRVMAGTRFGGQAELVAVREADLIDIPERLSFSEAAAIPVNYATAWTGLLGYGSLREGEKVLIHAAAGGVGIAATQIAKRFGAQVWGTASPSKHDAIRANGVDHPLDYTKAGWERGLPKFDLIMDALGGSSFNRSYELLRAGGRLIAFGASSVTGTEKRDLRNVVRNGLPMLRGFNLVKQMQESKAIIGLNVLTLWDDRGTLEPFVAPLQELMDDGTILPVVAEEVPFARAGDAHRLLAERRNVGKVVLVP
jgi:NADPH:quinone reductase-like Zn-dependent oxidoreductase